MPSVAETFKQELLSRVSALPLSTYGPKPPLADRIRRSHLTAVNRENAPAIYVRFGEAKPVADKSCNWRWELDWTVSVYVRSDNDKDADPLVLEVVRRLSPLAAPYAGSVMVDLSAIESQTEVADEDAQRVDVIGVAKYGTGAWSLEA